MTAGRRPPTLASRHDKPEIKVEIQMTAIACLPRQYRPDAHPGSDGSVVIDLVIRAREGDEEAWDALVDRYAPLIWSICRRHQLGDDADDVAQSVWLHLIRHLDQIRDPAALPGWLATTTRRECVRVRQAARDPHTAPWELEADMLPDEQGGPVE